MAANFKVEWIDRGANPTGQPNPAFPRGMDLDISQGQRSCQGSLPYPAPRIGFYAVECRTCGANAIVTTAGRRDDPRSIRLACGSANKPAQAWGAEP
jgi:hypothetical protein